MTYALCPESAPSRRSTPIRTFIVARAVTPYTSYANAYGPAAFPLVTGRTDEPVWGNSAEPAWLPDGRIVYSSDRTDYPNRALWLMNPDGTGQRRLTPQQAHAAPNRARG